MENELILLDTSVLIDFYRKQNKSKSLFYKLSLKHQNFGISVVTKYEILIGSKSDKVSFWNAFFENLTIIPFDENCSIEAVEVYKNLKSRNKLIEIPDLFIGATAKYHKLSLATLNVKHFGRIEGLEIIS
jgi:tRNA(fMet)-specific endonuclease VapC